MKISPDYEGRDDGYDDETVRYYEEIKEDGYFYEAYVLIDGLKAAIVITDEGVSVDFREGDESTIMTNIVPKGLFPDRKELIWSQIEKIIKIIERTEAEGKRYSRNEMNVFYEQWKKLEG